MTSIPGRIFAVTTGPDDWSDVGYWYPRYCAFWNELESLRIQDRKATLFEFDQVPEQWQWMKGLLEADLYSTRPLPSSIEFTDWWLNLAESTRHQLMQRLSQGLRTALEEQRTATQKALRPFVRF